jgi:hypothetical protein
MWVKAFVAALNVNKEVRGSTGDVMSRHNRQAPVGAQRVGSLSLVSRSFVGCGQKIALSGVVRLPEHRVCEVTLNVGGPIGRISIGLHPAKNSAYSRRNVLAREAIAQPLSRTEYRAV